MSTNCNALLSAAVAVSACSACHLEADPPHSQDEHKERHSDPQPKPPPSHPVLSETGLASQFTPGYFLISLKM